MLGLSVILFGLILLFSMTYLAVLGGKTGKWGAAICVFFWLASLVAWTEDPSFSETLLSLLFVDAFCFLAFLTLAMNSRRYWPIWAAGLQLAGVAGHFSMMLAPDILPAVYQAINGLWSIPIIAIMIFGTALDRAHRANAP